MSIDVTAETVIKRRRGDVASFAMDADNDPVWIGGIKQARTLTERPFGKGTRVERVAGFLGKRIEYINEVTEYEPESHLVMESVKSPFQMRISYRFEDRQGDTLARIRVEGETNGFYRLARPLLARAVKRSITNDLNTLKTLLESGQNRPHG